MIGITLIDIRFGTEHLTMKQTKVDDSAPSSSQKGSSVKRVPAVRRSMAILWELADAVSPMNLSHISRAVGVIPSTCMHILRELVLARLVSYDTVSKTYELGMGIQDLAQSSAKLKSFATIVKPRLQLIANQFNMTATATSKVDDKHLALTAYANPPNTISIKVTLGGRVPVTSGASGRVLAAFGGMSEKQIRQNFDKVKWVRPIDYKVWRSQVDQVVKDGYAEDKEGFVQGVSTLSVPVYNRDRTVSHTIGVFAINSQLEAANHKKILESLWAVADYIHHNLRN